MNLTFLSQLMSLARMIKVWKGFSRWIFMILVWFERSRGDEFNSDNNFQVEKNSARSLETHFEKGSNLSRSLIIGSIEIQRSMVCRFMIKYCSMQYCITNAVFLHISTLQESNSKSGFLLRGRRKNRCICSFVISSMHA